MRHHLVFIIMTAMAVEIASAQQQNTSTTVRTKRPAVKSVESPWSTILEISAESNFLPEDDADLSSMTYFVVSTSYRFGPAAKLFAVVEVDQDLTETRETTLANTRIGLSRDAIDLPNLIKFTPSVSAIAPTNEKERNEGSFRGSGRFDLSFRRPLNVFALGIDGTYTLRGVKNAHEYDRDNLGSANISHYVRHTAALRSDVNKHVGIGLIGYYQTAWTYHNVLKTAFLFQQDLYWKVAESTELTLFHRNGGNALEANGTGSNISIYDESTSFVGMAVTISI